MYNTGQKLIAEYIGTFTLLVFTLGSICYAQQAGAGGPGLLGMALAPGLAIAVMMAAVGHISGAHFNPSVTAAFWVTRRMGTLEALLYWLAQLHFGRFGGRYVKAIWTILGLVPAVLFVTGALMWWNRVLRKSIR